MSHKDLDRFYNSGLACLAVAARNSLLDTGNQLTNAMLDDLLPGFAPGLDFAFGFLVSSELAGDDTFADPEPGENPSSPVIGGPGMIDPSAETGEQGEGKEEGSGEAGGGESE